MIKLIALDEKQGGSWIKKWLTLTSAFENSIFACSKEEDVESVLNELGIGKHEKVLLVAHESASSGCTGIINQIEERNKGKTCPVCFFMYVGGGGLSAKSNNLWQYYSPIPFHSGDLSHLNQRFELLCKNLESAKTGEEVKSAWYEFDRSAFPETLTAAYLLMVANKKVGVPLSSMSEDQWKEAYVQFQPVPIEGEEDWSNASEWGSEKIEKIRGEIREKLLQVSSHS